LLLKKKQILFVIMPKTEVKMESGNQVFRRFCS
jgi:hypothetical protein